jgi:hypothetical protein
MRPYWEMGLGGLLAVLLAVAALHLAWLATHIGQPWLIILILALCYSFYLIRNFFRMAYGTVEIVIGFVAIYGAMGRAPEIVDDPTANLLLVQTAAGIYIIIRGFDNFAQSPPFAGGAAPFRAMWGLVRARWSRNRTMD